MKVRFRWLFSTALVLLCLAALVAVSSILQPEDPAILLAEAARDLQAGRFESAEQRALQAVSNEGCLPEAFLIAGEAAAKRGRFELSASYFRSGADCENRPGEKARSYFFAAESSVQCGRLTDAELSYQAALSADPLYLLAEDRLEFLYRTEGRVSESTAVLARRVESNTASFEQLLDFGHPNRRRKFPEQLLKHLPQLERDGLPMLGIAREFLAEHKRSTAEQQLRNVVRQFPQNCDAQAEFGRLLLDDNEQEFLRWFDQLHSSCRSFSRIWLIRGLWAERNGHWRESAAGFLQCLTAEPFNREATFHLSVVLGQLSQNDDAAVCRDQARNLESIEGMLDEIHDDKQTLNNLAMLIPLLQTVGRSAEARNWLRLADQRFGEVQELAALRRNSASSTTESHAWSVSIHRLIAMNYPDPHPSPPSTTADRLPSATSDISFDLASSESGITFEFVNSDNSLKPRRMIQSDGGGIGVFDIDADGWPDLYFTQGGEWPAAASQTGPEDRIFRNLRGKTFRDMTSATGVVDRGFGQGVTIGDLDCDGFPEVYVANAGGNRLFRNNGDGTLTDISIESGLAGNDWSTSCAIMDFDLNGHPDLYVVNYLSLDDASAEICHEEGKLRSCRPGGFMAADDRLYLNDGDWSFTDVSSTSGILQPDGRGLGIIAADFDGDRYPDIFVGNDAVPNFLFLNRTDFTGSPSVVGESSDAEAHGIPASTGPDGRRVRFEESAVHRGIATDEAGRSQACMGIACADFNNDQQPDIFVTNFYNEPNTLYLGQRGGMFVDRTRSYQLAAPSMSMLGFGTQPLDADLDGDDDLAILNGHIDDLSASGVPYRMKPQFFENQSGKVFTESEVKCRFFLEEHLGRSLARLDWNRDGREDLAAGVLEAPSVLLTNTTNASGSWLGLQLVGTLSARDATGSTVTVQWGEHSVSRQLTSGSGFQASNQNKLTFGIPGPGADPVVNVTVLWPNGQVNSFRNLETDCDYIVVQSQSENSDGRGPVLCTH